MLDIPDPFEDRRWDAEIVFMLRSYSSLIISNTMLGKTHDPLWNNMLDSVCSLINILKGNVLTP